jgi:hypothetical protein
MAQTTAKIAAAKGFNWNLFPAASPSEPIAVTRRTGGPIWSRQCLYGSVCRLLLLCACGYVSIPFCWFWASIITRGFFTNVLQVNIDVKA